MKYSNKSLNTLDYISLHDCVINHVVWEADRLIVYFDWIDVMRGHPLNFTGKAKIAYNSAIVFENAVEENCVYYDLSKAYEEGKKTNKQFYRVPEDAEVIRSTVVERCINTEISTAEQITDQGKNIWKCICNNDTEFEITFKDVWVYFNNLGQDSWLEFQPSN